MEEEGGDDDREKLKEIKDRWKDSLKSVCVSCLSSALWRHDLESSCYDEEKMYNHLDYKNDSELYAGAGTDIKFLLEFIEKIKK